MKSLKFLVLAVLAAPTSVSSGPYTAQMQNACPEGWEDTTREIPIVYPSTQIPWKQNTLPNSVGSSNSPAFGIVATGIDLEDLGGVHNLLSPASIIATISPATQDDFVADPLTIASNCLMYRNLEVDTAGYVAPVVVENLETGWIPAAIF